LGIDARVIGFNTLFASNSTRWGIIEERSAIAIDES
jgi:hypothetical protein